ncbi:MAG: hypothetical protein LUG13_04425 [Oscillospiraceae bacterium]|nr:hypothetical protein [Oscillospiraceae bacterium]
MKYKIQRTCRVERRDMVVSHPDYGAVTVLCVRDKLEAVVDAARRWGVQWSDIARECTFTPAPDGKDETA